MIEDRIAELETKVAYQEVSIQELDKAVMAMQKQIKNLEICCETLKDRTRELSGLVAGGMDHDEKPPHY